MRVTMVGGGVGASRLAVPLARRLGPGSLTLVVNTADDLWRYGLRVCPDLDTNLYALAGWRDVERGWGLEGDTFRTMDRCRDLGDDAWFSLGDLDLATHLLRTGWLRDGVPLHEVTRRLAQRADVGVTVLPMTDDEVATTVHTPSGPLRFQDFFVREGARPEVVAVDWDGLATARPAPGVVDAIAGADLVVLGPSNPVASVLPALSLAGVRDAVTRTRTVAVTPVVRGVPITDHGEAHRARSRAAMLAARGLDHSARSVAELYRDVADAFVLDRADAEEAAAIEALGLEVRVAATILTDDQTGDALADVVLATAKVERGEVDD